MSANPDPSSVAAGPSTGPVVSRRSELGYRLLLFLIVAAFFWKLVLTNQFDWIWSPDVAQQILPSFEEEGRQIHHGGFPLWDTHAWGGQPFPGRAEPGAVYPLNWLLWLIPRVGGHISIWALQWYYVVIRYMAALFMYLLCRDVGRGRAASLIAGLVFGLAGYMTAMDWPQMVNGAVWAPLVIMFVLRAARGVRPIANAAFAGLCLGIAWLSGHHEAPIHLTLASGGLWLYYIVKTKRPDWRIAGLAALAMVIMLMVGAMQILPAEEYGHLALRWAPNRLGWNDTVPYSSNGQQALYATSLFGVVFPGFGNNTDPFIGLVAVGLALLGITLAWKQQPLVKVFAALALGGLLFALGHESVYHGFIYAVVPWVEKARAASRAILIFHMGVAVLAAYGVDYFISGQEAWARRIVVGLTAFGFLMFAIFFTVFAAQKFVWAGDDRQLLTPLVALILAALLHAWRRGNLSSGAAQVLLAMLLIQEIGNSAPFMLADRADPGRTHFKEAVAGNQDIANFLHARPGIFRVDSTTDDLVGNWGDYNNLDFFHAKVNVTANTFQFEQHTWNTQMLFGVRYTLAKEPVHEGQADIFTGGSGIKVFENAEAFPRTWTVHKIIQTKEAGEGRVLVNEHLDELHREAFMSGPPPQLETCEGADTVSATTYRPSTVSLHTDLRCGGMVILSDTFYPGWRALVDGKPTRIYEVNYAMRGVVVPKGVHEVSFRYRPWSVYGGAMLTLLGVGAAFLLGFVNRRKT